LNIRFILMGAGSSVAISFFGYLQATSADRVVSKLILTSISTITQKLVGWNKKETHGQPKINNNEIVNPHSKSNNNETVFFHSKSNDNEDVSPDPKLVLIRQLLVKENVHCASFLKLIELNGNKVFVDKCAILEEMERKVFGRMFLVDGDSDDYHQLDDIVCLKDLLAVDNTSSPAIHTVFEKLYKYIYNYQASYERWMEILSMLQDELLLQLVNDYDAFIVCQAKTPQKTPKKTHRNVSISVVSDEITHQHIMQYPPEVCNSSQDPSCLKKEWAEVVPC